MDSLQALPRDTTKLRNILFTLPLPFSLNIASQFDESGFEIYSFRELIEVEEEQRTASRDIEAKLYTSETLDQIRSRFFEVSEIASQLDNEEKRRLLERWERELGQNAQALIGCSIEDWISRAEHVILF